MEPRRVVIVVFEGCQPLDAVGPAEVFAGASALRPGAYTVSLVSRTGGIVRGASGLGLETKALGSVRGPIDTLVVAGGVAALHPARDGGLVDGVRRLARRSRRITSVCTGAFLLAEAGLLDGKQATTHWWSARRLAAHYPEVSVDDEPIFIRDGDVWTSAGVTAGLDLALALVADDLGDAVAREIARWMVMFVQRPGGQSQFSTHLAAQRADRRPLRDLQDWITGHLADDLTVAALARRSGMSPRHFARAFRDEVGATPAAYVEAARVEAAKLLLATTQDGALAVARACGFGTVETFHRAFRRVTGTTPERYRQHFARAG